MNKLLKISAMAALFGVAGIASADPAETKGGIKVKTEDGRFEASIGGRIHFDVNMFSEDQDAAFGSGAPGGVLAKGAPANATLGGTYFRRIYITLKGKAYGWNYKIEPDFAPTTASPTCVAGNTCTNTNIAFQDVMISTDLGPGEIIIGQIKPFRAMTELTSSNDLTIIERPIASAAGIFNGREFQQGLFYRAYFFDMLTAGGGYHSLRSNGSSNITEGSGGEARVTFSPFHKDGMVLHTGVSYSLENAHGGAALLPTFGYGGRRGPALNPFGGLNLAGGLTPGRTTVDQKVNTLGLELAGGFGPAYVQAEYMTQKLDLRDGSTTTGAAGAVGLEDVQVDAWYVDASVFVTGEAKPYKFKEGVFTNPKPAHDFGAIELVARYEQAKSKDESSTNGFCTSSGTAIPGAAVNSPDCKVKQFTVGANWYLNPNLRFMLNYVMADADVGLTGAATTVNGVPHTGSSDKPRALVLRTQFAF